MTSAEPARGPGHGTEPADGFAPLDGVSDAGLFAPVRVACAAESATGEGAFLQALLDAEAALARAQAQLGLIPGAAARAITAAARAEHFDPRALALRARAGGNPVIPLVADLTRCVAERDARAAEFVHQGATSQDILDTALMLLATRTLGPLAADLARTADALGSLAAAHRDTPMAGRTLTQHAVPTTFGLKAAGWRALVLDARDRITRVRDALPAQLGGAAGTLAAFHVGADRATAPEPDGTRDIGLRLLAAYAAQLGLTEPELPWHTLRTPVADLGGALATCAGALGKLAADVLVLSRTEIGEVAEASGGSSSAMPHKSNPVRATLIASAARQVPALAAVLYGSLAAEDERPAGAWHAEWQPLRAALRLTGGAARDAAELAEGLLVRPQRMRAQLTLTGGLLASERLAAELTGLLGRAAAKDLLTRASHRATAEGIALDEALGEAPELAGALPAGRLRELLDPAGHLGSAPALTDRALARRSHPPQEPR